MMRSISLPSAKRPDLSSVLGAVVLLCTLGGPTRALAGQPVQKAEPRTPKIASSSPRPQVDRIGVRQTWVHKQLQHASDLEDDLRELVTIRKAFGRKKLERPLTPGEIRRVSDAFNRRLIRILEKLDVAFEVRPNVASRTEDIYIVGGPSILGRAAARYRARTGTDVVFSPSFTFDNGFAGVFDGYALYLSLGSILTLNKDGSIRTFLKATDTEKHEYLHSRFYTRRKAGRDDIFDFRVNIKGGYRRVLGGGYDRQVWAEELPNYVNDKVFYLKGLRAAREQFVRTGDVARFVAARDVGRIRYYFENGVAPMAKNYQNLARRIAPILDRGWNLRLRDGRIVSSDGKLEIYAGDQYGQSQIVVKAETEYETSRAYIRNFALNDRFRAVLAHPEAGELDALVREVLDHCRAKADHLRRFSEDAERKAAEAVSLIAAIRRTAGSKPEETLRQIDRLEQFLIGLRGHLDRSLEGG